MNKRITQAKLVFLLVASTVIMYLRSPLSIVIFCISIGILSAFTKSRASRRSRYTSIAVVAVFILFFQLLFNQSVPVVQRMLIGIIASLRVISLSFMVFLFTETTSVFDIVSALSFLPKKLCLMLTISFALIPAILRESSMIRMVQQTRGLDTKGVKVVSGILALIIPLLSRTLLRAEHIAMTLETRGYQS
ncbi:MAG TPA: energy-coupling factor transporter transmembrane component T [Patescibacteria group bacterium]|nr:energy-coupling factor transporter transmembrane component T [Patescibacteria group bacterium]